MICPVKFLLLLLLLLLLLFTLIEDLLLQNDAVDTGFEQRAHGRSLAFEMAQAVEGQGGGVAREVGELVGELACHVSFVSLGSSTCLIFRGLD